MPRKTEQPERSKPLEALELAESSRRLNDKAAQLKENATRLHDLADRAQRRAEKLHRDSAHTRKRAQAQRTKARATGLEAKPLA